MKKIILVSALAVLLSGCLLKTRAELGESEQSGVYSQRNADNQIEAQRQANSTPAVDVSTRVPDERDETIRQLNGRVEVLENALDSLQKEREAEKIQNEQKLGTLQEALKKLEMQINGEEVPAQKSTDHSGAVGATEPAFQSSDEIEAKIKAEKDGSTTIIAGKKEKPDDKKTQDKPEKKLNSYETAQQLFENKEWKKAILNFHKYTDESPKGKLVPDAKYKIGLCFQELSMKEEAMAYFEEVAANYPNSEAGKKSKARLTKLKK